MPIVASAPGKLVLTGDHAAVYNHPCLVTAIDIRYNVTIDHIAQPQIIIETPELQARQQTCIIDAASLSPHERPATAFVEAALARLLSHSPLDGGLHIRTSGPPRSFGLGSSSAITVATAAATAALLGHTYPPRALFDLAYAAVLDVQGKGSGVDVAAAVYGGTVYYRKADTIAQTLIEPLSIHTLPIVIGYSGDKVSTTSLINQVAHLNSSHPQIITPVLKLMGAISDQLRDPLHTADWPAAGELLNIHQGLLDALGVNVPQLATPIFAAREAGAWGAKLSGAGGGDCMFALAPSQAKQQVEAALQAAGAEVVSHTVQAAGVQVSSQ